MCGIAGLVNLKGQFSPENARALVRGMTDQMIHRGPDDSGVWVSGDNRCAFGHRRLSIIDLSPAGQQPMQSLDGKAWITFNGEIYNYLELRAELEALGVRFRTRTDTEVLIEAIRVWKEQAFLKLDGMYAFALYDATTGDVTLGRDPFGEKPLYYTKTSDYFAFASEVSALTQLPGFHTTIDDAAVAELLMLQYVHAPRSIYRDARKLPPGHWMRLSADGSVALHRHFSFNPRRENFAQQSIPELADELHELLVRSVKRRMISDVPLGAFLSGGVDSSLVVALMTQECGRDVQTFSIGFRGDPYSEHEAAKATARHLGTNHHEKILEPDVMKLTKHIAEILDEPNADSSCVPVYLLSQFAREHVTVAISGDGGDELFGGYGRYFETLREQARKQEGDPHFAEWNPGSVYFGNRVTVFSVEQAQGLMRAMPADACRVIAEFKDRLNRDDMPLMHRMRAIDIDTYMPGAVLAKVDRMSMQHALEVRTPFLSIEIARFAEKLAPEHCYHEGQGKLLLKELLSRYLPHEMVYRPKQGFGLPTGVWGKDMLLKSARDMCLSPVARTRQWSSRDDMTRFLESQERNFSTYQVWNVNLLEMWLREHRTQVVVTGQHDASMSPLEQALLPYEDHLPMLVALSRRPQGEGVYVGEAPPPTYYRSFFSSLEFVDVAALMMEQASPARWVDALPKVTRGTLVMSFARHFSLAEVIALSRRGYRYIQYMDQGRWCYLPTEISTRLLVPSFVRNTCGAIGSMITRSFHRVRRAIARRILRRLGYDLQAISTGFARDEGFASRADLPQFSHNANTVGISRSELLLFEGETLLVANAPHREIRARGCGRYSHWERSLYFSSSDNTDPSQNGRHYWVLERPRAVRLLRMVGLAPERIFDSMGPPADILSRAFHKAELWAEARGIVKRAHAPGPLPKISLMRSLAMFERELEKAAITEQSRRVAPGSDVCLYISHLGPGGAERQLCNTAAGLVASGCRVRVITEVPLEGHAAHYVPLLKKARVPTCSLDSVWDAPQVERALSPQSCSVLQRLHELSPDVRSQVQALYLHLKVNPPAVLHCMLDAPNIVGAIAAHFAGVPRVVLSFRNVNPSHFPHIHQDWYLPWYRVISKMPNVVFSANSSEGARSYAEWIGIDPARIVLVPNGVDVSQCRQSGSEESGAVRRELGIEADVPLVIGVFRLAAEKRPLLFLRVISEARRLIPNLQVVVVGIGHMENDVRAEVERLGLRDCVRLLGRRDDVARLIVASDVLVLVSEFEGAPNAVLEAQALGRPVVCSNVGAVPDIVVNGVTGFILDKNDEAGLVERIARLLKDPSMRTAMGEAARCRIENEFSIESLVWRTLSLYGPQAIAAADTTVQECQVPEGSVINQ